MPVPRLEGAPRDNVDPDAQEFLKVQEQADVIQKRRAWLEVHQQIEITAGTSLSPGNRAEYGDSASPALSRDAEDLRTPAPESL